MRMTSYYSIGTLVVVRVPIQPQTKMLAPFNGTIHRIKAWRPFSGGLYMYMLEDCVSEYGVPYWFADDWLVEVVE